jgi:hypothetical protein
MDTKTVKDAVAQAGLSQHRVSDYAGYLHDFVSEVEKALRVKAVFRSDNSAWVYYENDTYCSAWIGYGDFRVGGKGTKTFTVGSRLIHNNKYSDSSPQFHMAMTTKLGTAVKNAKRYISPLNVFDMASISAAAASRSFREIGSTANQEMHKLGNRLFSHDGVSSKYSPMETELKGLLTLGHDFQDKELEGGLVTYFDKKDETKTLDDRADDGVFVYTTTRMGEQQCAVLPVDRLRSYRPNVHMQEFVKWYTPQTLPDEMMGKFSMLQLVDDNHYVDGVGYRVSDRMCFLVSL